jgi:hypothetical protein
MPKAKVPNEKTPNEKTPTEKIPTEKSPAENTPAEKSPADSTPALNNPPDSHPEADAPLGIAFGKGGRISPMAKSTISVPQMMECAAKRVIVINSFTSNLCAILCLVLAPTVNLQPTAAESRMCMIFLTCAFWLA